MSSARRVGSRRRGDDQAEQRDREERDPPSGGERRGGSRRPAIAAPGRHAGLLDREGERHPSGGVVRRRKLRRRGVIGP
jgi:hypothetical protein